MKFKYLYIIILILALIPFANAAPTLANFTSNTTPTLPPLAVQFTDTSSDSPTGWSWFFGDETYNQSWAQLNASAGWAKRSVTSSVVMPDGSIILTGGLNTSVRLNDTWKSTNNGTTWTLVNSSSGWSARNTLLTLSTQNGEIFLMGGYDGTSYRNDTWKSTDNGSTWTQINASSGWSARSGLNGVVLSDGSIVIMGGYTGSANLNDTWKSTNNGTTWTQINASSGWQPRMYFAASRLSNNNIVITGGIQLSGTVYRNDSWRSTDNGATWSLVNSNVFPGGGKYGVASVVMPDNSIILMGGANVTYRNDVWKSSDAGSTWTRINASAGWAARSLATSVVLPNGSIIIMAGEGSTVYNDVWMFNPSGSLTQNPVHTYLIAGSYNVSLQSYNNENYNNTIKSNYTYVLFPPAPVADFTSNITSGLVPISVQFNDTSSNTPTRWAWFFGDEIWTKAWARVTASSGWQPRQMHSSITLPDGSIVLMGGYVSGVTRLNDTWKSTNNGTTWTLMNASSGWAARSVFSSVALQDGSILVMGGNDGTNRLNDVWKSTDQGATWTLINSSAGWSGRSGLSSVVLSNGNIIIMGGETSSVRLNDTWRSTDNGTTWTQLTASAGWQPRMYFTASRLSDNSIVIVGGYQSTLTIKYNDSWRSLDGGTTWNQVSSNVFPLGGKYGTTAVTMPDDSIVIMGGKETDDTNNVSRSSDYGATWTQINASAGWTRRTYLSSAVIANGSIIIMGGLDSTGSTKNDTWLFNPVGSSSQNPVHTYSVNGKYNVSLQAINSNGFNNTIKSNYINVTLPPPPVANFSGTPTSGPTPLSVTFTDSSTNNATGWGWFFGDEVYTQAWTQKNASSGWTGRFFHNTVILLNGSILLFGGNNGGNFGDIWMSTNDGATWTLVNSTTSGWGTRYAMTSVRLQNGNIILMGGYTTTYKNDTWKSTDNGKSWTLQNASSGWVARLTPSAVVLPDDSIVLMGGNSGSSTLNDVWRSTDEGVTWVQQTASAGFAARYSATAQVLQNGTIVYMGGGNFGGPTVFYKDVWGSTDKGVTWTQLTSDGGWAGRYGLSSVVMPDNSLVIMGGSTSSSSTSLLNDAWRSTNGGATWTRINASSGWVPRTGLTSVVSETGNIIVTGGFNITYRNDAWALNPVGSSSQNPLHTYTSSGSYNVALTSYNNGGYNTTMKNAYITTINAPVANFTSNITTNNVYPMVVQFNDTSENLPVTWNWSFGDGRWFNTTNSALKNTTYTYAVANKYNVSLIASNTNGTNITVKDQYINLTSDDDTNVTVWTHMNGTNGSTVFASEKGIAWTTNGGAQISTLQPKYGGASGWFPWASNSYISTPNSSALQFGTGDFTIEFWMNVTTVDGTNEHVFSKTNNPRSRGWGMDRTDSATGDSGWDFYMGNDSRGQVFFNAPILNKTWVHIAIERQSGTIYLYINGNLTNSSAGFNANYDTSDPLWIGRQSTNYYDGYVDEFRISKTARWKSNFTPPYNEYRGYLEAYYPDINPESTFRYKTNPGGNAYVDNLTPRNRTLQIQNISNATYVAGQFLFSPLYGYVTDVRLNLSYYPTGMTLISYNIDNIGGTIDFNISKPTGFSPGTDRASILDYRLAYINYTDGSDPITSYFGYGYLTNGTTGNVYGVHNFLGTPVTYGNWNFTANFTATNRTVSIGQPTTFNATFNGSYPNRWNWSFGDGEFDNGTNTTPTHSYTSNGNKTISLTEYLWQNGGVFDTKTTTDYISVGDPPVADFTMSNQTGILQLIVRLNDTSTNSPSAWNWSIDDNDTTYQTIQNPVYALDGIGNYSIKLNASNIFGSSCITKYANISEAPITNFTMNVSSGIAPLTIQFTDDSSYGPIVEWNWSFGNLPGNYSNISNPIYTFTQFGNYTVTLYTRNIFGTNVTNNTVNVSTQPIAEFIMSNTSSNTPLVVQFNDTSLYLPTSWNWSFGDGNYSDVQNSTYIFNYVGNYTVTLNASNFAGSNCVTHYANATENLPPIASFTMSNTSSGSPLIVQFNDTSVNSPDAWNWSFGEGNYSNEQNPNYTFITVGNYTITLNASNILGSSIATQYAEVLGPPTALFTTNTQVGGEPLGVNFTDISTSTPTAWNWSFNDRTGNNTEIWFSTLQNPDHSFLVGNYTIKLNASNAYGYNVTPDDYWINVSLVIAPIADFTSTSTGGPYPPVEVQFNDTSINFPTQWNWSFGDGNVSALQNPLYNYTFCGSFDVLLRVENGMGVSWKNTTQYINVSCVPIPPTPDERIAGRMADIEIFVVTAAIILVVALVATFIYMWAKRRS